jgi:hypothetical protein
MSKSTKRQRSILRQTWLTPAEDAIVQRKMKAAGVTMSELIRLSLFGYKPPRRQDETEALSRLSGEIGKIGGNINQIAYHLNAGRPGDRVEGRLDEALRELLEWRTAVMHALGAERNRKPKDR